MKNLNKYMKLNGNITLNQQPVGSIKKHWEEYMKAKDRIDYQIDNTEEHIDIQHSIHETKIQCFKYNYSLDKEVQNIESYPAFIELSEDFKFFKIVNRKPNEKIKYLLEADPQKIQEAKLNAQKQMS